MHTTSIPIIVVLQHFHYQSHVILHLVHPIAQPLDGNRGVRHPQLLCALTRSLDRRDVLSHPLHALAQLLESLALTLARNIENHICDIRLMLGCVISHPGCLWP